jgi:chemotaxis protein MotB
LGKQAEPEPPAGAPDWIVTFADMISLLVTFFILLMTFSSMEAYDAFQVDGDLLGTTGTLTPSSGPSAIDPPENDRINAMDAVRGAAVPHRRPSSELLENLEEMGQKKSDEHTELDLKDLKDGLLLRFDERATFAPGSTELSEHLRGVVVELARTLEHYPYTVAIEGHTDGQFVPTLSFADETALSAGRAASVAQTMIDSSGISPLQLQLSAAGSTRPVGDNETPEGRLANRRVEIRIISLSQARAAALKTGEPSDG